MTSFYVSSEFAAWRATHRGFDAYTNMSAEGRQNVLRGENTGVYHLLRVYVAVVVQVASTWQSKR